MGPHSLKSLAAATLLAASAFAATTLPATHLSAQVFVVGEKTATADVVTEFHPTHVELPTDPLTVRGHLDLIRNLEAEQGFAHRELPLGAGLTLLANGNMTPAGEAYKQMLYQKGESAAPGDRVEVSALQFNTRSIVIDFNGGPYAKHRFLSHISFNDVPIAQLGPVATGFRITLVFEGDVPELTAAEVKALLDPLIDFKAHSASEAYANTLTPKVRESIEAHEILVGMDRRMVIAAVGEPKTKHREQVAPDPAPSTVVATKADLDARPDPVTLEEWIYGDPPEPTQFVRFRNGKVIRLEIAAIGKPLVIRDHNELDMTPEPALLARTIANGDASTASTETHEKSQPPSLRRPGEVLDTPNTLGKVRLPGDTPDANKPANPDSTEPDTPDADIPTTPASITAPPSLNLPDTASPNPPGTAPTPIPPITPSTPHFTSTADRVN
jgi:hypothetical protein